MGGGGVFPASGLEKGNYNEEEEKKKKGEEERTENKRCLDKNTV